MQGETETKNKLCFFGEKFSEQDKNSLRKDVCRDLPVEFEQDGNFYCVLHFPNNQKVGSTNFRELVKERVKNQENNFCGVYFLGKTDYFFNHQFETEAIFERAFFEEALFEKSNFNQECVFSFSTLQRADFQEAQFSERAFFIGATFATESYQPKDYLAINFSESEFTDAVFQDSIFNKHPHFNNSIFEEASFLRAKFLRGASFFSTTFKQRVSFERAIFNETTNFHKTSFDCDEKAKDSAKKKSFIITSNFRNARFQDVRFKKTVFESVYFQEVVFEKVQFWESTFNGLADFDKATFNKLDFYKVMFANEAHFKKASFKDKGGFFWSRFIEEAHFDEANFEANCDVLFNFTSFEKQLDLGSANISGYLSFNGSDDEKVFFNETDLNLEFIRIEKPEKVSFHTVDLHSYWFVNIDSRKFTFANIGWGKGFGNQNYKIDELKKISNRGVENPEQIFKITCRQLAENAENNNRFEEASNFRWMAFECERLERRKKISKWWTEPINCLSVFRRTKEKIKSFPFDFFHWTYRWTSGYGENRLWALLVLFFIIVISAFLYATPLCEFPNNHGGVRSLDFIEAISYSLRVMVLQRPEPFPVNTFGKVVLAVETVLAPLQAALLALAIRRKFMR